MIDGEEGREEGIEGTRNEEKGRTLEDFVNSCRGYLMSFSMRVNIPSGKIRAYYETRE